MMQDMVTAFFMDGILAVAAAQIPDTVVRMALLLLAALIGIGASAGRPRFLAASKPGMWTH